METIKRERLARWGEQSARSIPITGTVSGRKTAARLSRAMERVSRLSREENAPAWYADNEYLSRREGHLALEAFRSAGKLRRGPDGAAVVTLCCQLVEAGPITEERVEEFLTGARRKDGLPETEAALVGAALRMAVILALAEGADTEKAGELFTSLRTLAELDLTDALEHSDPLDALLRKDEIYPRMDEATRAMYRAQCQKLARKKGTTPLVEAQTALDAGLHEVLCPEKNPSGLWYIALVILASLCLSLWAGFSADSLWVGLLTVLPITELVRSFLDSFLLRFLKPRRLPRLSLEEGLSEDGRTVCAVSALLADDETGPKLVRRMEEYRLASRECGENLLFALLADMPDSATYPCPEHRPRLEKVKAAVEELNETHGGGFFLLTRDLQWNEADKMYTPWERKRGAILELVRLFCGRASTLRCLAGDREALYGRYILCLDGDTRLVPGAARSLIGAAMHPANRPQVEKGVVVKGHGILHPRMSVELSSALATDFARVYVGQGGTDPYGAPTGELFFDLFRRGGFSGKGILDAEAYLACTEDRFGENRVLSHDALEGAFLRGAYMGDVELTDGAPVTAQAWFRRMHRWVRGDWQNAPWLFGAGRDLALVDRWKLFDSLRRSLIAPVSLLVLVLCFFLPSLRAAAWIVLLCLGAESVRDAFAGLFARTRDVRLRCRSGVLRGLGGSFTRLLARLLFLPWEGFTCLTAALSSLWRMTVSHKNMLAWVTAAQADRKTALPLCGWLSVALGLFLLLLAPGPVGKAMGIVWLFTPAFAAVSGTPQTPENNLSDSDRRLLMTSAQAIWSYFSDACTQEEHYLPPDNIQIQPPKGTARRTSPTNIGLAIASALAALELEIISREEAETFVNNVMSTIEDLPSWKGHLFNWYDTATGIPLQPAYVSTVDSGNLCACLLCTAHGFRAHGMEALAHRLMAFAQNMELAPLYDRKKRLFHIGLDPTSGIFSPGHYDLMASEARLTSYVACARGEVPLRHWQSLSRAQLSLDGWQGLASWSGSMFEYLMPELFLPLVKGSMLWETARFCVYAQRQRGRQTGIPWGNSESGYYSLDAGMDYRYKAHGTGALALRRDVNSELVTAPYASFLALCVHPKAAVKNLRRLKKLGMWGKYGFYEAYDMTPGRIPGKGKAVESFMSHHLGMSLCAIANCLKGGVMRQHFMTEPVFRSYKPLLAERVSLSGAVLRRNRSPLSRPPEERTEHPLFHREGQGYHPQAPAFFPLSNGVYSLLLCADGEAKAQTGGLLMYHPNTFEIAANDIPLTPSRRLGVFRPWRYAGGVLTYTTGGGDSIMSTSIAVSSGEFGELRRICGPSQGHMTIRFQPVLARTADYYAHPTFWSLGLQVTARGGAVFVRRLSRGNLPEVWLCLAATTPLKLEKGGGWQTFGPVTAGTILPEGGCSAVAIAFGATREDAHSGARRILAGGTADMAGSMASLLGLSGAGLMAAFSLCGALSRPRIAADSNSQREKLWRHGLSGDLPILYVSAGEDLNDARRAIKRHALLSACGVSFDLVLATGETGDYLHPRQEALHRYLEKYGLDVFEGISGGIRFITDEDVEKASVRLHPDIPQNQPASLPALRMAAERGTEAPALTWPGAGAVSYVTPPLPPRAWSNVLTNGRFGYLAADCGTGFMWMDNARECPINLWENDPMATRLGETLDFITPSGRRSLFADGQEVCRVTNGFGWTRWEHEDTRLTAFVPLGYNVRIFLLEGGDGGHIGWHLPLALTPSRADAPCVITGFEDGFLTAQNPRSLYPEGIFRAVCSRPFSGYTGHEPSWLEGQLDGRTGAGLDPCFGALWKGGGTTVLVCGCEEPAVLRMLADPDRAGQEYLRLRDNWRSTLSRVHIKTPDRDLNRMMNGWAAYQALSCRVLGRTSLYQNGGAYGFRDQLQDVTNLLLIAPARAKKHILLCCARQFTEGDVLHWWHETPQGPHGVRTRCSDDLLWLSWALCEYTEKTGDLSLCREMAPWLEAPPLAPEEKERYFLPGTAKDESTVLEHACRAMDLVLRRSAGPHGLLLTGSGDWNDGMDKVGGESLWLTWFFLHIAPRMTALMEKLDEPGGSRFAAAAKELSKAAEHAWDGCWYLRGWWQDGAPLGSAGSPACSIDATVQSWAAFSPTADRARVRTALRSCVEHLWDEAHGLTKLFAPPFRDIGRDPGYIRAYGPGFRENGGQYTHGGVWLASALLKEGFTDEGAKMLLNFLPARHNASLWGAEPYIIPADVSANEDHYGEALWSWYTGSAGWFFRVVLEDLLGIRLKDGHLVVEPKLPSGWEGYEADICGRHIRVSFGKVTIT